MGSKANEGVKKSLNFDKWMADAIQKIADTKKMTFTSVVLELLRQELAFMGYTMGIGREGLSHSDEYDAEAMKEIIRERSDAEWAELADKMIDMAKIILNEPAWGSEISGEPASNAGLAQFKKEITGEETPDEAPNTGYTKLKNVRRALKAKGIDPNELQLTISDYRKHEEPQEGERRANTSEKTAD
jgi:hypothetical protein